MCKGTPSPGLGPLNSSPPRFSKTGREAGTNYGAGRFFATAPPSHNRFCVQSMYKQRRARKKPARRRRLSVHGRGAAARPRPEARSRCGAAGADAAAACSYLMSFDRLGRRSGRKALRLRLWSSWSSSGLLNDAARVCMQIGCRSIRAATAAWNQLNR